jgi:hypothetical protein
MVMIRLPLDFKEFLQLLNDHHVEYLLVGGYAVAYYGYPRATGDIAFLFELETKKRGCGGCPLQKVPSYFPFLIGMLY